MKKILLSIFMITRVFALEVELTNSDKMIRDVATPFIVETFSLLPKSILKVLNKKDIILTFKDLNPKFNSFPTPCSESANGFKYGKHVNSKISLDIRFLDIIKNKDIESIDFHCKQKNLYKLAQATLLHEISHAYDRKTLWFTRSSNDVELKALGFWDTEALGNKNYNDNYTRSPDGYEYKKRSEYFAVNFEYFMLDPEYKCRRPGLYKYYEKELSHSPFKNIECDVNRSINYTSHNVVKTIDLDKDLIKEVQFLLAAQGPQMMSRWGHSMIKLVVCKTKEDSLEECRNNSQDHVVISFLAYNDEMTIGMMKGIFGGYPSRMLVSDIGMLKTQYTRAEFRSLKSLPIKLNDEQRERFLNHVLRVYWEYAGSYFFFTNNCADEALKLIQLAINDRDFYKEDVATPIGLYDLLIDRKLINDEILKDRKYSIENGFLYESYGIALNKVYNKISKKFLKIKWPDNIELYTKLSPSSRKLLIVETSKVATSKADLFTLFGIESHANFVDSNKLLSLISSNSVIEELGSDFRKMLEETIELKNIFLYGKQMKEVGYGIPLSSDLENDDIGIRNESQESLKLLSQRISIEIRNQLDAHFLRYEEAKNNLEVIKNEIRNFNKVEKL